MDSFDEYRKRWVYVCSACGNKVTAFRDCGPSTFCKCGNSKALSEVIEPKHIESSGNSSVAVHTFKPYFDVTLGKVVESKHEISEYCKRNDMVYAGDKELTQQCEQNKRENEAKFDKKFSEGLVKELGKVL